MPTHETIDLTTEGPAARILLNRPEALNAWNEQFGLDLLDGVTKVAEHDSIRALLIVGAGRGFSSGADLKEQRGDARARDSATRDMSGGMPDLSARLRETYHPIITGLREMPKPVVAAVNGPAVGIGCSLALAADLILAAEPPTSCSPSSTSAWSPMAARRRFSPRGSAMPARPRWRCSASACPRRRRWSGA
jgi:2-(1,2-epoxy-1,2-dihydrophenyl)acetyl-CoA isomerase